MRRNSLITFFALSCSLLLFSACQKSALEKVNIDQSASGAEKVIVPVASLQLTDLAVLKAGEAVSYNTFYGTQVEMGNGNVRSWINIDHDGKPLAIGVEMTPTSLDNLPQDPTDFAHATYVLPLHQKARAVTPFDHITINWNVHGHEPEHVYDLPHFDFHFYKITVDQQMAIPPYEVAPAGFDNYPAPEYFPPAYFNPGGGVPQMGAHWIDVLSPEFHGVPFTHTFIYGSYNGKVTFEEPMITLETIQNTDYLEKEIRQPQKFDPLNTNYPTGYKIWKDDKHGRHYVALYNFVWQQ